MSRLPLLLIIAACSHGAAASSSSTTTAPPPAAAGTRPYIDAVSSADERHALEDLIQRADDVLHSEAFAKNLAALAATYPTVYISASRPAGTLQDVADLLALRVPGSRQVPVAVALVGSESYGGAFNYSAYTGPISAFSDSEPSAGSMSLGRVNMFRLRQWDPVTRAGDIVDHSCAINTMTHEMTHTISTDSELYVLAFTDEGVVGGDVPVASYLVGSVAQCTYLQLQKRIEESGVSACVEIFGVRAFNNLRCPAFSAGQPIEARDDLPPAAG